MRIRLFNAVLILALICSVAVAQDSNVLSNRTKLESELNERFGGHYLVKECGLDDKKTKLSVLLEAKTWRNPNDTKALVDSIESVVKNHLPLARPGTPQFIVFIDEPVSGMLVAAIKTSGTSVTTNYTYTENRAGGKKITAGSKRQQVSSSQVSFRKPIMSMWSGVKLYYGAGSTKTYVGKIVCFSGDDVRIETPSGGFEWKSRNAIINLNGHWFVDKNDPALKAMKYYECY